MAWPQGPKAVLGLVVAPERGSPGAGPPYSSHVPAWLNSTFSRVALA